MPNFFSQLQRYKKTGTRPILPSRILLDIAANAFYSAFLMHNNRIYITNEFTPKIGCRSQQISPLLTELILAVPNDVRFNKIVAAEDFLLVISQQQVYIIMKYSAEVSGAVPLVVACRPIAIFSVSIAAEVINDVFICVSQDRTYQLICTNYAIYISYDNEFKFEILSFIKPDELRRINFFGGEQGFYVVLDKNTDPKLLWYDYTSKKLIPDSSLPIEIKVSEIKSISVGVTHILLLDGRGRVWGKYSNVSGQLGVDNLGEAVMAWQLVDRQQKIYTDIYAGEGISILQSRDAINQLYFTGRSLTVDDGNTVGNLRKINYFSAAHIKKIVGGTAHILFLTTDFKLFAFGQNDSGYFGAETPEKYYYSQLIEVRIGLKQDDLTKPVE